MRSKEGGEKKIARKRGNIVKYVSEKMSLPVEFIRIYRGTTLARGSGTGIRVVRREKEKKRERKKKEREMYTNIQNTYGSRARRSASIEPASECHLRKQ